MTKKIHISCPICGTVARGIKQADKYFYRNAHCPTTGHEGFCKVCKRNYMRERMRESRRIKKEAEK